LQRFHGTRLRRTEDALLLVQFFQRLHEAAQYAREIAEKQAQRELLQQEESPDEEIISRIEAELTQLTAEETQNREALAEAEARLNEADAALESVQSQPA